jgi:hypothetical protein
MMRKHSLWLAGGALCALALGVGVATARAEEKAKDPMPVANPSDFHWKPKETLPPGANAAVVYGDPKVGSYDFFGKFPAKYTVPMHWHSNDCMVVMMKGSMVIGRDKMADVEIKEGGFFMLPGKMRYTAHCAKECIFLVHGAQPFDIFYANPKDDPRNAAKK